MYKQGHFGLTSIGMLLKVGVLADKELSYILAFINAISCFNPDFCCSTVKERKHTWRISGEKKSPVYYSNNDNDTAMLMKSYFCIL